MSDQLERFDTIAIGMKTPLVSVVMPIRNEEKSIAETVQQVLDQQTEWETRHDSKIVCRQIDFEILVVDGCSTDRTWQIVGEFADRDKRIKLLNNSRKLSSSARNIGIENASGQYIVIIDGHCEIPSCTHLVDLVRAFERTGADCLGRPQPLNANLSTALQQAIGVARNSKLGHHPDSFIYSNNEIRVPAISIAVAYRREVFNTIGMFDPSFDACEDCELNHRIDKAGLTCYLVPDLAVCYQPRNSLRSLFLQLARYGRGRVRLFRKHLDAFSVSSLVPALFLIGIVAGPILSLLFPPLWYLYFGVLVAYAVMVFVVSVNAAIDAQNASMLALLPMVFLTIHLGCGWGVLHQAISGFWSDSSHRTFP